MAIDVSSLWVHEVSIEPFEGTGPYGDSFEDAATVACLVEQRSRQVRVASVNTDGAITLSSTTVYADLDTSAPVRSRVTLPDGTVTTVLAAYRHDGGGLPTPDHLELLLE